MLRSCDVQLLTGEVCDHLCVSCLNVLLLCSGLMPLRKMAVHRHSGSALSFPLFWVSIAYFSPTHIYLKSVLPISPNSTSMSSVLPEKPTHWIKFIQTSEQSYRAKPLPHLGQFDRLLLSLIPALLITS